MSDNDFIKRSKKLLKLIEQLDAAPIDDAVEQIKKLEVDIDEAIDWNTECSINHKEEIDKLETSIETLKSIGFDKDITIGLQMGEIEKLKEQITELRNRAAETIGDLQTHVKELRTKND